MSTVTAPKHRLLVELGRGGMGSVQLAMTRGPRGFVKLVVLKLMRRELLHEADAYHMFMEEARISGRLCHENIVQIFEVIEHDGVPAIVMEYLDGQQLSAVLGADPPLSRGAKICALLEVLEGLHAAHEARDYDGTPLHLVHRDVSPQNVIVQYDGRVKILDFGIAKVCSSGVHTETGVIKGKLRYMSPEQLAGERVDRRSDLFSVGLLVWEALVGTSRWSDLGEREILRSLAAGTPPELPSGAVEEPRLAAICIKGVAPEPCDRYETARDMQAELEAALGPDELAAGRTELLHFMATRFERERRERETTIEQWITARPGDGESAPDTSIAAPTGPLPLPEGAITRQSHRRRWPGLAAALGIAGILGALALPAAPPASPPLLSTVLDEPACPPDRKTCDERCVARDEPEFGCSGASCRRCDLPHASARCNAEGGCAIAVCHHGYADCDRDPSNGCEVNTRTDPDHCGACGEVCPVRSNAERGCGVVCTLWRCEPGFRDCNHLVEDGCERDVRSDARNCGHCGASCGPRERCVQGRCEPR